MVDVVKTEFNMDMSLDDIDDLPSFNVPPSGAYNVTLTKGFEQKTIGTHKAIDCEFKIDAILEVTGELRSGEELPKIGDIFSAAFMVDNNVGLGKLKEVLKPLGKALGTGGISEIMTKSKGMTCLIIVKRTYGKDAEDKTDYDKKYADIKAISPL